MADFLKAWAKTSIYEGGYCNVVADRGGETYKGIARIKNPGWRGWHLVDQGKGGIGQRDFPNNLERDELLQGLVHKFYKSIWDSLSLDRVQSQFLADSLFDVAVNMGYRRAVTFLQTALNFLNRKGVSWDNLDVDGALGPRTLFVFSVLTKEDQDLAGKVVQLLRGHFYLEIMSADEEQEKFARGWLKRVDY